MLDAVYTATAAACVATLTPALLASAACVRVCRAAWLYVLESFHPDVEFIRDVTVRTLADTPWNQGVFTVLVRVAGEPRVDVVRRHLQEVVTRRRRAESISAEALATCAPSPLKFPKLSKCLVSRWGSYAWKTPRDFQLDRCVTVAARRYRGRPVTDSNIQECVSEIVSKHLPRGAPAWQLVVVPLAAGTAHYLLLRMHHLLLTDGDVNIADLLPISAPPGTDTVGPPDEFDARLERTSPLLHVFEAPEAAPRLCELVHGNLTNRWNEFISLHDPVQRPELLKTPKPGLGQCTAAIVVAVAAAMKGSGDGAEGWRQRLGMECERRGVSTNALQRATLQALHPSTVFSSFIHLSLHTCILAPRIVLRETRALASGLALGYSPHPNTAASLLFNYAPLVAGATKELAKCVGIAVAAPRAVIQEVARGGEGTTRALATCGRKVVAWSRSVKLDKVQEAADKAGVSETAVLLWAVSTAIRHYWRISGRDPPPCVPVVARHINKAYLFASGSDVRPHDAVGGALCLRLPLAKSADEQPTVTLLAIEAELQEARERQPAVYLLTLLQTKHCLLTRSLPAVVVAVAAKYLSKRYALAVTEFMANEHNLRRVTAWGAEVTDVLYWRPPQSNMRASLCMNHYGDEVTLAVMADALLTPYHAALAVGLREHIDELRKALGLDDT